MHGSGRVGSGQASRLNIGWGQKVPECMSGINFQTVPLMMFIFGELIGEAPVFITRIASRTEKVDEVYLITDFRMNDRRKLKAIVLIKDLV